MFSFPHLNSKGEAALVRYENRNMYIKVFSLVFICICLGLR